MKRVMMVCVVAMAVLLCTQDMVYAVLYATSHSAVIDTMTQDVTFSVTFNENVNFMARDQYGRQADSFQFYIDIHNGQPGPTFLNGYPNLDTLTRISELTSSWAFPIRIAGPASSDPTSGGWGAIRGWSTLSLVGRTASFTTNLDVIGADLPGSVLPGGQFSYDLLITEYGGGGGRIHGVSTSVPEPATLSMLVVGGIALLRRRRK